MARRRKARQQSFTYPTWGGKRAGAGRPRRPGMRRMKHGRREVLKRRFPVHVTIRMVPGTWNLRAQRCFQPLLKAFGKAWKPTFQVVLYSVMGNHLHLIVEADNEYALSCGMKGLGVRVARALNKVMGRRGQVIADRYHTHILKTPTEVKRARFYLLNNAHHHFGLEGPDWCTSQTAIRPPRTYLLRLVC